MLAGREVTARLRGPCGGEPATMPGQQGSRGGGRREVGGRLGEPTTPGQQVSSRAAGAGGRLGEG